MTDTPEQVRQGAERLVAQREAQGLPRTLIEPEIEALERLVTRIMEGSSQAPSTPQEGR